jgi:hypothetical protein
MTWMVRAERRPAKIAASGDRLSDERSELHAVIGGDHFRRFFSDHDRWCARVSTGHVGHDAGIRHAKVPDAEDSQPRIDAVADPAGAGVVLHG